MTPDQLNALSDNPNWQQSFAHFAQPKKKGNFLTNLLPSAGGIGGSLGGAALGTAILPGIGTLAGALLGGAAGGGAGKVAENAVEHNKLSSGVAGEAAINGILGAGPLRLGKVGVDAVRGVRAGAGLLDALKGAGTSAVDMSATQAIGDKLQKSGQNLIAKEFRLNPTQQANFAKLHGEEATSVLRRYGVKSPEDIQANIQPLQDSFDNAVSNIPDVSKSDLASGLQKVYQPLLKSPALFEQGLGSSVKQQADELLKLAGDKTAKTAAGKFNESDLRQMVGENIAGAAQSGGKSAKAITRAMLSGGPRDAYGITMNAFAQSPNKAEISDLVTKVAPQLEGTEKNRLVKDLVDIKDPQEAANRLWQSVGTKTSTLEGSIPADRVNDLRKTFDAAVNYTQKGAPEYNVIKKTADALRTILQSAADKAGVKTPEGMSFKDVGKELSKLHGLDDVVSKQSYLGTGSLPLNMPNLLGATAGAATGGLPGAAISGAATQLINSPAGRRLAANSAIKAGEKLSAKGVSANPFGAKSIATRVGGVGLASALSGQLDQSSGNNMPTTAMNTNTSTMPSSVNISPLNQTSGDLSSSLSGPSSSPFDISNVESNLQKLVKGGATDKQVENYLGIVSTISDLKAKAQPATPKLNSTQLQQANNAQSGLDSLSTIAETLKNNPNAAKLSALPGGSFTQSLTHTGAYSAALNNATDVIGRLRSGGAINADEEKRFKALLPSSFDGPDTVNYKLNTLAQLFQSFANPQASSGSDLQSALGA